MESNVSYIPIEFEQLDQFSERAARLLSTVKWTPKGEKPAVQAGAAPAWRESSGVEARQAEVSILKSAHGLSRDPLLLTRDVNHCLLTVRDALRIGMHLSKTYTRFSGLDQLVMLNERGGLAEAQKVEFRSKYLTASAITIFASAYYVVWELERFKTEELSNITMEVGAIPELSLQDPVRALDCVLFYYGAMLQKSGLIRTDLELVKATLLYFSAILDEIKRREESLLYAEPFTTQHYKLKGSEFAVSGFKVESAGAVPSVEFNRVELGEIVGNRDAKHEIRRLAARLMCYDPAAKRNPMYDLGGLAAVSLGYGEPGTGKSMLIAALATLLDDYCKNLGVPFLFTPMPDTIVSTYQGGSAERMMAWMRGLKDPSKIIYAPIDDAENNLEERSREGVSAGVREVIAVFLRNTEGAYAVNRGNSLIQLFTNLPDQIDKAVLSRINNRMYIGGAITREDFLDQDYLWYRKHAAAAKDFVNMREPKDYTFLTAQAELKSLDQAQSLLTEPRHPVLKDIYQGILGRFEPAEQSFFAEFFAELKRRFPFFTSRDLRNIQRAVDGRILDFDLPAEWLENREIFAAQPYDVKRGMIVELMRANMRGLSFAELRLQEALRYLENMLRIAEGGQERRIGALVDDMRIRQAAQKRLVEEGGQ